ncbi:diguanylate cyclase [Indiicoccus explosivorum]|uniref:diguanylate cyclase n=1 Tax=Indiicoccus explosivorum TaxID=1917864 RepID=UPI0013902AE5|nr:diguanylate cyclase [Indiicoccus explosivorum]
MNEAYQEQLRNRIKSAITSWTGGNPPTEREVYHFFRALRGTAATLGVTLIAEMAGRLMELYGEESSDRLSDEEVHALASRLRVMAIDQAQQLLESAPMNEKAESQIYVLLIDQDLRFANFMKEMLETQGIHVVVALTARKGMDLFYDLRPDFVMIDMHLPDMDGLALLAKIADRARKSFIPVVVLASDPSKNLRIRAFELGAIDYIGKPIDPEIFLPYFRNRLSFKNEIQRMVILDELTGAYNRRYLKNVMPQHIHAYRKKRDVSSFVLLDLDHFKRVNDTYGHSAGDAVLREFAQVVKNSIREQDGLFRFGGEEFALLLPSTTKEDAREIIQRIRSSFAKYHFTVGNETFSVTFSAGITETGMSNLQMEKLTDEADQALYYAKEQGRDCICIYDPEVMGTAGEKVLEVILLDDDPLVRAILTKQAAEEPPGPFTLKLRTYRQGTEFLNDRWYRPNRYYLILIDGVSPKIDGLQVLQEVRAAHPNGHIFISMLSDKNTGEDIGKALEYGADDHLLKPFTAEELLLRISRLMAR